MQEPLLVSENSPSDSRGPHGDYVDSLRDFARTPIVSLQDPYIVLARPVQCHYKNLVMIRMSL